MTASADYLGQHSTNGGDTRELAGAFDWALETGERLGCQGEPWGTLQERRSRGPAQRCLATSMIGFGGPPQVSSGNPPTFIRPPTQLLLPPAQCARPPNPVEFLPHIAAAPRPRFLVPTSAMEPRIPGTNAYARPFRPVTFQPFLMPLTVQHPPPNRYPPPLIQQQQQSYPPQRSQFVPTRVPPPASYQPQQQYRASTSAYPEPEHANGQSAANWGAGWEGWEVTELKKSLYSEFANLFTVHGALGERDRPVLGLFMGMPTEARQLIKECGGVKAFLLQSPKFGEEVGGKIFLLGDPRPHVVASSADSGQGSWEGNTIPSRPPSVINPNAMEFVPSECSFSEASSDDVFVEGSVDTESTSESAFKGSFDLPSTYGFKITHPEDYTLEDFNNSLEDGFLPDYKDNEEDYKAPADGDLVWGEEIATGDGFWGENSKLVEEIATGDNSKPENPDAGMQLDNHQGQLDSAKGSDLVVQSVPGESRIAEDVTRKGEVDREAMASGDTISRMCRDADELLQGLGRPDDLPTDSKSHMYSEAGDKDSRDQITFNGAVAMPQTEGEANMPESITQAEDGINNGETIITEDTPCSCATALDFPTFHDETATVEESLDTFFQELQFNKDGTTDAQEHDEPCCQANVNKNNNNVDQQSLTDEITKFLAGNQKLQENVAALHQVLGTAMQEVVNNAPQEDLETAMKEFAKSASQETLETVTKELAKYDLKDKLETAIKELAKSVSQEELRVETTNKEIQQLHANVTAVQEDLETAMEELAKKNAYQEELETAKKEIQQLQENVTALQEELETAKKELKTKESATEQSHIQLAAVNKVLTARLKLNDTLQEKVAALEEELETARKELAKNGLQEVETAKKKLARNALEELLETAKKDITQLQKKVTALEDELETAKKELKTKESATEQSHLQLAAVDKEMTEKVTALEEELAAAKKELDTKESDREQVHLKLAAANKVLARRQHHADTLQEKVTALEEELETAKKELAKNGLQKELETAMKELAKKSVPQEELETAKKEIQQLRENVTALQEELETAKKELKTKESAREQALLRLRVVEKELTQKVTALQKELETAKKELKTKESAREQALSRLRVVEKEHTEKVTALQKELETAKKELKTKESATEQSHIQLAAVNKVLTARLKLNDTLQEKVFALEEELETAKIELAMNGLLEKVEAEKKELAKSALQELLQTAKKEICQLQNKVTALQDELETAKKELKTKESAAEQSHLQLVALEKKLTEKLPLLQKELETANKALKTKDTDTDTDTDSATEESRLQLAALEKEMTERLQHAETQLQESLQQQNCCQDLREELKKAQERASQAEERATRAELQVLNFTFRWCRSELEDQYKEGEKMYRFYTERCRLGDRELKKFCCEWQDYTSDILKQITEVQLLYSNNVQKLQSGEQLFDVPPLSLVRPQMPRLPDLTPDMLTPPDSYKLHLVPLLPVEKQPGSSSTNPSLTMPTGSVDWSCIDPHKGNQVKIFAQPQPVHEDNPSPDATSPKEAGIEPQPQPSGQQGSLAPPNFKSSPFPNSKSHTTQDNSSTSQGKRSPEDDVQVQPPPKAKVSEDKQRLRLPSGISKAASISPGGVSKRRTRTESGSSCGSNVTEASVASLAGSSRPPGLVNLQEPMVGHSSPKEKSQKVAKTSMEPCKAMAGNKDSLQPGTTQSGSSENQGNQSASMMQGAAGHPPYPPPGYQNVASLGQSAAGYVASHPMGFVQSAALPLGYAGHLPHVAGHFMPNIHQFSSAHPGVFEFAGHHHVSPNVQPGASNTAEPPASIQPSKELLKTPASFSTKTSDDEKTSFTQAVRPKSTISSDKARALAQQALTPDALDTQNKYQALDTGTEDTTEEEVQEAAPEAKGAAESSSSDETVRKVASPVSELSNVQEVSKFPEVEGINNADEEWQLQLSKKKRKVLAAVKESEVPQTSAKVKLLDRLHADLPGYSRQQLLAAAAAVRRARHGTLSTLPFCVITSMVKAELLKSQPPSNQPEQPSPSQTPPGNQVRTMPGNHPVTPPGNHAAEAPLSTEAQGTSASQACEPPSLNANESIEPSEGNLQLAKSLLQLKYKTEMCRGFSSSGTCRFGDKCLYAHGLKELRRGPKLTPCPAMQKKGHCPNSDSCIFAHSKNDLKGPGKTPEQVKPAPAVRTRTSPTARMRLVDLKTKKEQMEDRLDKRKPLWQTLETRQPSQSLEADVCAICVDDLYDLAGSSVRTLDCGHRFHDSCVSRWLLKEERTCPCCRQLTLLPEEFPRLK